MQQRKPIPDGTQTLPFSKSAPRVIAPLALACAVATAAPACDKGAPAPVEAPAQARSPLEQTAKRVLAVTSASASRTDAGVASEARSLRKTLNALRRTEAQAFHQPDAKQAAAYRDAVVSALSQSPATPIGFSWLDVSEPGVRVLAEHENNSGAGAVVVRSAPRSPVVIQAPHTFFDSGTLPLAIELFERLNASVLMINTQHRAHGVADAQRAERARAGKEVTDVAHNAMSYYQAAHEACLEALPEAVVVQIHGYRNGQEQRAVVSAAGTNGPAQAVAREINAALGQPIARLFPDDVQVLGGMTNVQARASRAENHRFVHLELSTALRKSLADDQTLRDKFSRALVDGLGLPIPSR